MAQTKTETEKKNRCPIDGKNHTYGPDDKCTKCGFENKTRKYWKAGRTERTPKRGTSLSKTQVKQSLALLLSGSNSIFMALQPELSEDALTPQEIGMLADVLGDEVDESPQLKKLIQEAGKQSTHVRLIIVLVMIAAPRLVRRGIIPEGSENLVAAMEMAARGTHDGSGGDEQWEVDVDGGGFAAASPIPPSDSNEDGPLPPPDPVPSANGHKVSADVGEPKVRTRRVKAQV